MPTTNKKLFIAMAGNIGCGKTTAAKTISQTYGYELFDEPVVDNRFLKDYYADMTRWSFTLQLEFLIKRTQHHELIATVKKSCIQDRTLLEDPEVFAKYLHGLGHMNDKELDLYFDYMGILLNGPKADGKYIVLNWSFTDTGQKYVVTLENSALTYVGPDRQSPAADATLKLARTTLDEITLQHLSWQDALSTGQIQVEGNPGKLFEVLGLLEGFQLGFNIVTP